MKKLYITIIFIFAVILLIACSPIHHDDDTPPNETKAVTENNTTEITTEKEECVLNYSDIKAIWLSQFDMNDIYTEQGKQRDKDDFQNKIITVLNNVKENGFNTVFLQVRPYCDSFFPSEYYPPSRYVTGNYSNNFSYDPIQILIQEAHKLNLSIHGWINPLRAMTVEEIKAVDNKYTIKQWYLSEEKNGDYLMEYNGRYYINPAYSETRQLIIDGVTELVSNYNFDGVHMDDYFYPTTAEAFDLKAYRNYVSNNGSISLKQFRYDNLNKLVSGIYSAIKSKNSDLLYGISPEGNMSNALNKSYADVYTWCSEEGYIDYICPQIYFGLEHQSCPFDKTADKWESIIKNPNTKLIIGMTLGKALSQEDKWAGSGKDEWKNSKDILKRCLIYTNELKKCTGVAVFCYQYYYDPVTSLEIKATLEERNNFTPELKEIVWNEKNY